MIESTKRIIAHHHVLNGPPVWTFTLSTRSQRDNVRIMSLKEYTNRAEAEIAAFIVATDLGLEIVGGSHE